MHTCRACGEESPDRARFCAFCGARFETAAPVPEARRTVTILFCDVVGSTALGERSDPETVRRVLTRVFDMARPVIEKHGGVVEKFIGDAVMAVFGLPVAHEDDALRAIRAAEEIVGRLEALDREFERQWGVAIQLRTGINTGEVATGDPVADEIFATGDAVNVAARLEQAAEPMAIVIGERTRELTRGSVRVEPLEPLRLKGKSEPVPAFKVLGVSSLARETPAAPLEGRERECGLLQSAFRDATASQECRVVTVLGEAGVGKTRLVTEFVGTLPKGTTVLRGGCLCYGEAASYWPLQRAIREFFGLGDLVEDAALRRIASVMERAPDDDEVTRAVADLTGVRESVVPDQQVRWAVRRFAERLSAQAPLVLFIDDLQWAQPALLDLVGYLRQRARTSGMLILCTARPQFAEQHPDWARGESLVVPLSPLPEAACEAVIAALLDNERVSDTLVRHVTRVTKGNPLFVEEVVAQLVRDEALEHAATGWTLRGDVGALPVPSSLQSVLDARLDALDQAEREVLERASIIGEVFYEAALETLLPPERSGNTQLLLRGLAKGGLIQPTTTDLAGETAFKFHHVLLRDVAELRLRKSDSAYLHERFAQWLEARSGAAPELAEIIGFHLEQAYRQLSELGPIDERGADIGRRAAEFLALSARRLWDRANDMAAGALFERAARLLPPDSIQRARLLANAGKPYAQQDEDAAQRVASEIRRIGDISGDAPMSVFGEMLDLDAQAVGSPVDGVGMRSLECARRAMAVFAHADDPHNECWVYLVASATAESLGMAGVATGYGERAVEIAARIGLPREYAMGTMFAIGHYVPEGQTVAERIARAELGLAENPGNKIAEALISGQLGLSLARAARFEEAEGRLDHAMAMANELGSDSLMAALVQARAGACMYAGDWDAAEAWNRRMVEEVGGLEGFLSNRLRNSAPSTQKRGAGTRRWRWRDSRAA